jgi:DNA repair exonuclease SbcCD ATPase subunit
MSTTPFDTLLQELVGAIVNLKITDQQKDELLAHKDDVIAAAVEVIRAKSQTQEGWRERASGLAERVKSLTRDLAENDKQIHLLTRQMEGYREEVFKLRLLVPQARTNELAELQRQLAEREKLVCAFMRDREELRDQLQKLRRDKERAELERELLQKLQRREQEDMEREVWSWFFSDALTPTSDTGECPDCGAPHLVLDARDVCTCLYCGERFQLRF